MSILLEALYRLFDLIEILILARIILSYIPKLNGSKIAEIIFLLTEPILHPVRELLVKIGLNKGMIDFSPIGAYLLISLIRSFLTAIL